VEILIGQVRVQKWVVHVTFGNIPDFRKACVQRSLAHIPPSQSFTAINDGFNIIEWNQLPLQVHAIFWLQGAVKGGRLGRCLAQSGQHQNGCEYFHFIPINLRT
jgi:hypothetical protein